jgi:hypothetical protein
VATNRADLARTNQSATGLVATLEFSHIDLVRGIAIFRLRPANNSSPSIVEIPLSQITPNSFEDQTGLWYELVKALLGLLRASGSLPDFVRGFEVQTGEDSTGEPALYVDVLVNPTSGPASDATVDKWSKFTERLQEALLQLRLQRWPYVRVGEWRGKK